MGDNGGLSKLSSLPDDILANILSRLQINSAVATSVLSHRWRYLCTGVTTFKYDNDGPYVSELASNKFSTFVVDIVRQLTSQTLRVFKLQLSSLSNLCDPSVADACFREVCGRNVEQIIIKKKPYNGNSCFSIPAFLFSSKNLEVLILKGMIKFDLTQTIEIQLPNLRKISLNYIVGVPHEFLGNLFRSCQRLIDAKLIFNDYITKPETHIVLNISAPNLRSLRIKLLAHRDNKQPKILIDAPKLETLYLESFTSDYYSIQNSSKLVKATIHMFWKQGSLPVPLGEDCRWDLLKFVGQISSVRELSLWLLLFDDEQTNLYHYLNSINLGLMLTFPNLECLETNLNYGGWLDLLLSMRCFPNLRHFTVSLSRGNSNLVMDPIYWCVPECLSKLKTIVIVGLQAINDELRLLGYILSNALVLEKLQIEAIEQFDYKWSYRVQLRNACKFCKSLFQLPRASSTCEIVFSLSGFVKISSNDQKNENLICEISSCLIDIP